VGASAALPLSFAKKKGECLPVQCIRKYSAELRRCLVPAMAVDVKVLPAAAPAPAPAAVASVWKVSTTDFGDDDELLADDDLLDEEDMRKPTADELQGVCVMPIGRAGWPCEPFHSRPKVAVCQIGGPRISAWDAEEGGGGGALSLCEWRRCAVRAREALYLICS
jgi:hypothetical protein